MKLIIKYFTCEGRFSRLYAYHIRLLMHFTKVRMMSIPYFICKNIERIIVIAKRKPYPHQLNSIYHFLSSKLLFCISSLSYEYHGKISFPMKASRGIKYLQILKKKVNLSGTKNSLKAKLKRLIFLCL